MRKNDWKADSPDSRLEPVEAMDRAYAELNERGLLDDAAYTNFGYIASALWPKIRAALGTTGADVQPGDWRAARYKVY